MPILPRPPHWLTWRSGLLGVPLLLVIWMGVASYQNLQGFKRRVGNSDRIFEVLNASTSLFSQLEDAESGKRGYLLTGKESFLEPYRIAVEKVDQSFRKLLPLAGEIQNGALRLERLRTLSDDKIAEMQKAIDLYRTQGLPAALEVVEDDATQHHMGQIRDELTAFISDAYQARRTMRDASVTATSRTNLIVTLGALGLFLVLAFATVLIERDQQRQHLDALQIQELNQTLENKVSDRTHALEEANRELESFCYSVSHDLRAPLRSVEGFAKILARDYTGKQLDTRADDLMRRMSTSTVRMGQLIDDLLNLSRIARGGIESSSVDLSEIAAEVARELASQNPGRQVDVAIVPEARVLGDARLLRVAIENLFGNAWKFTRDQEHPRLEFGQSPSPDDPAFFVRDNGVGFDMAHSAQLFVPFQRLHSDAEFEGTGIGLATVQRVIHSHGGRIWAESTPGVGATFYFTIATQRRPVFDQRTADLNGGGQSGRRVAHA
jgi:signal transduction histidine kinase